MAVARRQFLQERPPTSNDWDGLPQRASVAVEPVSGWWTSNGKWGNRYQGPLPPAAGELGGILNLDRAPGPPRPIGIQLFRSDRNVANFGAFNSDAYARITYGAGGVTNVFDVDFLNGQSFPVVANSVRVDFISYNPSLPLPYSPAAGIVLGATIGLGAVGCRCPTLTIPTGQIATGGSFTTPIPDFAKGVSFISTDYSSDATNIFAEIRTNLGQPQWSGNFTRMQPYGSAPGLTIPGNAAELTVVNNSAIHPLVRFALVFHLGL